MIRAKNISQLPLKLDMRRREVGISILALSQRSGVSHATVARILSGKQTNASWSNLVAIAEVLGLEISLHSVAKVHDVRAAQARRKAHAVMKMLQGTSALEGQAIDTATYDRMLRQSESELLAGSNRKLWSE